MFHINNKGEKRICRASIGKCRFVQQFDITSMGTFIFDRNVYEQTIQHADSIEQSITSLVNRQSGFLSGLEFKCKTKESLAQKILERQSIKDVNSAWDIIRFTAVFEMDKFWNRQKVILDNLQTHGFTVAKIKQSWQNNGDYKGTNVKLLSPEGVQFELQFHIPESLDAKQKAHKIYEILRIKDRNSKEAIGLNEQMQEIFLAVPIPPKH